VQRLSASKNSGGNGSSISRHSALFFIEVTPAQSKARGTMPPRARVGQSCCWPGSCHAHKTREAAGACNHRAGSGFRGCVIVVTKRAAAMGSGAVGARAERPVGLRGVSSSVVLVSVVLRDLRRGP
jgi:hypothetical protein